MSQQSYNWILSQHFPNLQVVGVMGQALQAVSPGLISSILQCVKKTDIPLSNQKAAIFTFRLMDVTDEVHFIIYSS